MIVSGTTRKYKVNGCLTVFMILLVKYQQVTRKHNTHNKHKMLFFF